MAASTTGQTWLEHLVSWMRSHPFLIDCAIAVGFGSLGVWSVSLLFDDTSEPVVGGSPAVRPPLIGLVVVAVALAHLALAWRRRRPFASFALIAAATGFLQLTSIWWLLPSVLVVLVSLYSYSAYGQRQAPSIGLGVVVVGAAAVTIGGFSLAGLPVEPWQWFVHVVVRLLPFAVAAWSLGMFRRVRVAYVAALEERAVRAEAEREERARRAVADERARIAREIHDVVAHALSVVISQADGGRYAAKADPAVAVRALTTIGRTGRQALGDMRGLLQVLRTGIRDDDQFPHPALVDLPELFERVGAAGVPVTFEEFEAPEASSGLSPAAELAAFRVVQEALTNTIKHAGGGVSARVRFVWSPEAVTIAVCDDGVGGSGDPGQGLLGMRERLAVVGGRVEVGPIPDGGFSVEAWLPRREVDR